MVRKGWVLGTKRLVNGLQTSLTVLQIDDYVIVVAMVRACSGMAGTGLILLIDSLLGPKHHQPTGLASNISLRFLCLRPEIAVHHGFGKHSVVLGFDSTAEWFKYLYAFELLYTLGMATVKYSM